MKIIIDADGCPVIGIASALAEKYSVECVLVCDTAHVFSEARAKVVTVEKGADSADMAIVNMAEAGDIVVTQDYGLAALCLARNAVPMSQDGMGYNEDNIDALLMARHIAREIRRSGGRTKGPRKRTRAQDEHFREALTLLLESCADIK